MSFFRNDEHEFRSGWKIFLAFLMSLGLSIAFSIIFIMVMAVVGFTPERINTIAQNHLVNAIIGQLGVLIATFVAFRMFFRKSIKELGLWTNANSPRELVFGLVFGAVSISAVYFILRLTGHVKVVSTGLNFNTDLLTGGFIFLLVGFSEEIFFRGYVMTALDQMRKPKLTIILSSVIFAIAHLGNPNLSFLGIVNICFVGVLFAVMYIKTGSLWMPIGFHITWNYFQGNILGLPVSGLDTNGLITSEVLRADIVSGGAFGPEGGLVATLVIGLSFVVLNYVTSSVVNTNNNRPLSKS